MTEERWQHIHQVFQDALERPAAARQAWLDTACATETGLRAEVESLLEAATVEGRFDRLLERFEVTEDDPIPERIGPYRVLREVGRGGMGIVYLGEGSEDDLHRPVALKVFHAGALRADLVGRFLAERQILSRLDHPNIARLHSGGVTDTGRPYFAMEYVEGRPITEYCDARRLGVEERLRLFMDVGAAVQHAHRHLVVHRDLKPSNILVTESGEAKLLDFGIAKLLDDGAVRGGVPMTHTGVRLMTPEYASPEQVRGESMTTATDVYQLGVLLYELLTGRRPYRVRSRLLREVERVICEEPPERPSAALTRGAGAGDDPSGRAEEVGRTRGTTPERLRRRLAGDLDTIVLTAMRKEPERRYASVEALSDDLRRHLDGLPVRARPDTLGYRTAKFVRRHRLGLTAAAVIAMLVLASGIAMTVQAARIAQERNRARAATAFLAGILESFEPAQTHGGTVQTREVLDRAVLRIRSELGDQPLVQATLMDALGQVYHYRGHFAEADSLLSGALALRSRHLGPGHLDAARSQFHLALLLERTGAYDRADSLYGAALATYRRELGPAHPDVIYPLSSRAGLLMASGDREAAETLLRDILATYAEPLGDHTDIATSMLDLGRLLLEQRRYAAADSLFRGALAMRRRLMGEVHPTVANALDALGEVALERDDRAGADSLFTEALVMRRTIFEDGHPDLAASLENLGTVRRLGGAYAEAESLYLEALSIYRRAFGERHQDAAVVRRELAVLYDAWGRPEQAARYAESPPEEPR